MGHNQLGFLRLVDETAATAAGVLAVKQRLSDLELEDMWRIHHEAAQEWEFLLDIGIKKDVHEYL